MKTITTRELNRNFNEVVKDLPVIVTRRNQTKGGHQDVEPVCVIIKYHKEAVEEFEQDMATINQPPANVLPESFKEEVIEPQIEHTAFVGGFQSQPVGEFWTKEEKKEHLEEQTTELEQTIKKVEEGKRNDFDKDLGKAASDGWSPNLFQKLFGKK